jgi:hypothetical protein
MAKPTNPVRGTERPKSIDTLVNIVETALAFRYTERNPTIADVARVVSTGSRLLHMRDLDERISVENACVLEIAKKRSLIS